MSKLYVFGIGGSGSRVLKSLTMLLSSGIALKTDKIVPMIIDTDVNNGDLEDFRQIIRKYNSIQEKLYDNSPNNENLEGPFRTKIELPRELSFSGSDLSTLADTIGYNELNALGLSSTKALIDLLFTNKSREMNLEKGFFGIPSIGSLVLKQVIETSGFKDFTQEFKPGDRIFIISSIFGGTGAAGFPLLLNVFRDEESGINNSKYIKDAIIGGISILPYFEVNSDRYNSGESAIDSNTFVSKTKAALAYYDKYLTKNLNALFYASDYRKSQFKNYDGGENQRNQANFIEWTSALSIIEFCNYQPQASEQKELEKVTRFFQFGIKSDSNELNLTHLGSASNPIIEKLINQKLLAVFLTNYLEGLLKNSRSTWVKELKIPKNFISSELVKDLIDFYSRYYYRWLYQLQSSVHGRRFIPFHLDIENTEEVETTSNCSIRIKANNRSLLNMVTNIPAKDNSNMFRKDSINFDKTLIQTVDKILQNRQLPSFELRFITLLTTGIESIYFNRYKNI